MLCFLKAYTVSYRSRMRHKNKLFGNPFLGRTILRIMAYALTKYAISCWARNNSTAPFVATNVLEILI